MRLHYLQHVPIEDPGSILDWAGERGHVVTHTRFFAREPLPAPDKFDWLLIMGGPMNIYEEEQYPWLAEEKAFIRSAIDDGKTVIGFCLGAQLIADSLGGKVTANPQPEIGWLPVVWNEKARTHPLLSFFPKSSVVFEWHYDTFSQLPAEAEVLAESAACPNQMFQYGERVFGFQFHLENTPELLERLCAECGEEMKPAAYVQTPEEVLAHPEHIAQNNQWMAEFLLRLEAQEGRSGNDGACQLQAEGLP